MINTVEQLIKQLEAGELVSLINISPSCYELVRADKPYVTSHAESAVVNEFLKKLSTSARIFTCMFPGCGPGRYLGNVDNPGALRYEVDIRWVNRPSDPITFD